MFSRCFENPRVEKNTRPQRKKEDVYPTSIMTIGMYNPNRTHIRSQKERNSRCPRKFWVTRNCAITQSPKLPARAKNDSLAHRSSSLFEFPDFIYTYSHYVGARVQRPEATSRRATPKFHKRPSRSESLRSLRQAHRRSRLRRLRLSKDRL